MSALNTLKRSLLDLVRDEQAAEVLDYALVVGIIVVGALTVIGSVGTKVLARWTSLDHAL